jgi:hypothetical protein
MPNYHFDLQSDGERLDALGGVTLADDGAALSFGKRVIRELLEKNHEQHAHWTMEIKDGDRTVHSIPVETASCRSN